jgi:uncharacterized protein
VTAHVVRPMRNRDSQFFWDGTAAGGKRRAPHASLPGTVFSYVVHRHPPVPGKELPIVIALIDLDEGVRMVGEVVDVGPDEIAIGMRLRVDFNTIDDDLTLPVWRRAT